MLTARTEPSRPRRQRRKVRQWALLLPVLALAASGCAQEGTGTPQAAAKVATSPATVTVGPTDGSRTLDLKVGDRLIVELTGTTPPSRLRPAWTLRSPASKVLRRVRATPTPPRSCSSPTGQAPSGWSWSDGSAAIPAAVPGRRTRRWRERADAATPQRG